MRPDFFDMLYSTSTSTSGMLHNFVFNRKSYIDVIKNLYKGRDKI